MPPNTACVKKPATAHHENTIENATAGNLADILTWCGSVPHHPRLTLYARIVTATTTGSAIPAMIVSTARSGGELYAEEPGIDDNDIMLLAFIFE